MKNLYSLLAVAAFASMSNAQIVINEVYGGGSGGTAVLKHDFVELKNIGTDVQTLTGASLQYASAAGTFNSFVALPSITLNAGQTYLIEMIPKDASTVGAELPTADFKAENNTNFSGTTFQGGFAMAAANGKIALAKDLTQVTSPTGSNVQDFVGYGTANTYEGAGAAPAIDASSSAIRVAGDTNNNAADFIKATPTPRNMLSVGDVNTTKVSLVQNTVVANEIMFAAKANVSIINMNGQVVRTAEVNKGTNLNVSDLTKGMYIVTAVVNGKAVSQKIIKK